VKTPGGKVTAGGAGVGAGEPTGGTAPPVEGEGLGAVELPASVTWLAPPQPATSAAEANNMQSNCFIYNLKSLPGQARAR
jgi:hypothetical protein